VSPGWQPVNHFKRGGTGRAAPVPFISIRDRPWPALIWPRRSWRGSRRDRKRQYQKDGRPAQQPSWQIRNWGHPSRTYCHVVKSDPIAPQSGQSITSSTFFARLWRCYAFCVIGSTCISCSGIRNNLETRITSCPRFPAFAPCPQISRIKSSPNALSEIGF